MILGNHTETKKLMERSKSLFYIDIAIIPQNDKKSRACFK